MMILRGYLWSWVIGVAIAGSVRQENVEISGPFAASPKIQWAGNPSGQQPSFVGPAVLNPNNFVPATYYDPMRQPEMEPGVMDPNWINYRSPFSSYFPYQQPGAVFPGTGPVVSDIGLGDSFVPVSGQEAFQYLPTDTSQDMFYPYPFIPEQGAKPDPCYPGTCNPDQPSLVPICDEAVCLKNCHDHFGLNYEAKCFHRACFCRQSHDIFPTGAPAPRPPPTPWRWSYANQHEWPEHFPECGAPNQSPISVSRKHFRDFSRKLEFHNLDSIFYFIVVNSGQYVRLYVQADVLPSVTVYLDNLEHKPLVLGFIELHWGSEHSIDGSHQDLEAQFHFFDLSFDTYDEAVRHPGSVLVLSTLYQAHRSESHLDEELIFLLRNVSHANLAGVKSPAKAYLASWLSKLDKEFFPYHGTSTSPPCHPGIQWLLSSSQFHVAQHQLEILKGLLDEHGNPILWNSRHSF